mgnify:CR=1 FL=1
MKSCCKGVCVFIVGIKQSNGWYTYAYGMYVCMYVSITIIYEPNLIHKFSKYITSLRKVDGLQNILEKLCVNIRNSGEEYL